MNISVLILRTTLFFVIKVSLLLSSSEALSAKTRIQSFTVERIEVTGVNARPSRNISQESINRLANDYRAERFPTPRLSLQDVQDIAYRLSRHYQENGFTFVSAIVPKQTIRNKVVTIQIREDRLADIQVRNATPSSEKDIRAELVSQLGEPVFKPKLEETILLLNDHPNRDIFAYFSRGVQPGETRLNLNVQETSPYSLALQLDNYGSASVGSDRLSIRATARNPIGWNDALHVSFVQSVEHESNRFGAINYEKYMGARGVVTLGYFQNQYQMGEELSFLDLNGQYESARMGYRHKLGRNSEGSMSHEVFLEGRQSELSSDEFQGVFDQKEKSISLGYQWAAARYHEISRHYFNQVWSIQASRKLDENVNDSTPSSEGGSDDEIDWYPKLAADLSAGLSLFRFNTGKLIRLSAQVSLQYSDLALPSADKMSLTGHGRVRAYEAGAFGADQGIVTQLQLNLPFTGFNVRWKPYVLYDYGWGQRKTGAAHTETQLSGYGFGLDAKGARPWMVSMTVSTGHENSVGDLSLDRETTMLANIRYQFDG